MKIYTRNQLRENQQAIFKEAAKKGVKIINAKEKNPEVFVLALESAMKKKNN